jgi:hypothetical protein
MTLMAYWFRFFRSCWNMFDFSIVAIALIVAGQGLSVTRTTCLLIALKPADDTLLALAPLTCPLNFPHFDVEFAQPLKQQTDVTESFYRDPDY